MFIGWFNRIVLPECHHCLEYCWSRSTGVCLNLVDPNMIAIPLGRQHCPVKAAWVKRKWREHISFRMWLDDAQCALIVRGSWFEPLRATLFKLVPFLLSTVHYNVREKLRMQAVKRNWRLCFCSFHSEYYTFERGIDHHSVLQCAMTQFGSSMSGWGHVCNVVCVCVYLHSNHLCFRHR